MATKAKRTPEEERQYQAYRRRATFTSHQLVEIEVLVQRAFEVIMSERQEAALTNDEGGIKYLDKRLAFMEGLLSTVKMHAIVTHDER